MTQIPSPNIYMTQIPSPDIYMTQIPSPDIYMISSYLQRSVFVKVTFLKISNIETVKEQFSADVFIKARWREPSLDHGKVYLRQYKKTYGKISIRIGLAW